MQGDTFLRNVHLQLNPKKCILFQEKVNFLGHVVSSQGIQTDPDKIKAVREWPTPKNKHDIRSFLGLCSYYRRFVKDFGKIAKPLHQFTENRTQFMWTPDCQQSFQELKHRLITAPILAYPVDEGLFILDTDASQTGIGAVLSQIQHDEEVVIGYFSKTLGKAERNYCVTRKELLAVVRSIEHYYTFLYGRNFIVRSDHSALQWLLNFKNPEGQLARWMEKLQSYKKEAVHFTDRLAKKETKNDIYDSEEGLTKEEILEEQRKDGELRRMARASS